MHPLIPPISVIATILTLLVACYCGYVAAIESEGPRKGKSLLAASLLFSFSSLFSSAGWMLYEKTRPVFKFNGSIESVNILNLSGSHFSAYIKVRTTGGGDTSIHVSDRSPYLRPDQRLWIQYRGDIGGLIQAKFVSETDPPLGELHHTSTFAQVAGILLGIFCSWAGIRKYRRDPLGAETFQSRSW